ncbi:MAG: NAD-dependent epimerase/dehydratase family protein [Candidatus Binatia bacterium]
MRPILVTGGTGFLGRHLVEYLMGQGRKVRVIGRRSVVRWRRNPGVEHIRVDIAEPGVVEEVLAGVDRVYHLAAATRGDWATYRAVTVDASAQLLESFAAQGGGRIVFVSSLGNYDGGAIRDGDIVDEAFGLEQNPQGRGYYARAKVEAERIAQSYLTHPSVKLTIVRPGVIYGPGMKNPLTGVALPIMGKMWVVPGKGEKPVPLIYIDDVIRALVHIMEREQTVGRIYNLVHPQMHSQNQYLALYRKLTGDRRLLVRIPSHVLVTFSGFVDHITRLLTGQDRQLGYKSSRFLKRIYYSCDRLKQDTGFQAQVSLEEGMRRMFDGTKDG